MKDPLQANTFVTGDSKDPKPEFFVSILDTRISVRLFALPCVTFRVPLLDSETGWTGEVWSKTNLLS